MMKNCILLVVVFVLTFACEKAPEEVAVTDSLLDIFSISWSIPNHGVFSRFR